MERDGLTSDEADNLIAYANKDMHKRLAEGKIPVMRYCFGLEPDYLDQLL